MTDDQQADITHWLNNAGRYPLLPPERVSLIARQIQALPDGSSKKRRLVHTLVKHNLRLVVRFVRLYMTNRYKCHWGSTETVDYLQVGAMGLSRAAELFDPTRGYAFSTYANHWIRSAVTRHHMKSLSSLSVSECASRRAVFYRKNGYIPVGYSGKRMSQQEIHAFLGELSSAYNCASFDQKLSENGGVYADVVPDSRQNTEAAVYTKSIEKALEEVGVTPIGRHVLLQSYVHNQTNHEIASQLGVTLNKVKVEKRRAMELAQAKPEVFADCYTG